MIDVKEAVNLAVKYFTELSSQGGIVFEEVELAENGSGPHWLVTLSVPAPGSVALANAFAGSGTKPPRDYKVLQIDAENGSLESVKIRKL
jgi:hypothetical protein